MLTPGRWTVQIMRGEGFLFGRWEWWLMDSSSTPPEVAVRYGSAITRGQAVDKAAAWATSFEQEERDYALRLTTRKEITL